MKFPCQYRRFFERLGALSAGEALTEIGDQIKTGKARPAVACKALWNLWFDVRQKRVSEGQAADE